MTEAQTQALRFRIWQYCEPLGWNVTLVELSGAMGENKNVVRAIVQYAGWTHRLRTTQHAEFREDGYHAAGTRAIARYIASQVASGKINMTVD